MPKTSPVALMAADAEDLQTISAMLQDAIVKVGDIAFLKEERRFAFVTNRFMWEVKRGLFSQGQRVRAGVHFDDVKAVRSRAVRMTNKEALLDILSLEWEGDENGGTITINLAGGGLIALDVDAINVTVEDISEPWRARRKPDHEVG
ncbi:MAG: DUF2948 family protein [Parvularculaceae bacterium]|nr:DUF2948 family protein [Parvularculaceae bacterium]